MTTEVATSDSIAKDRLVRLLDYIDEMKAKQSTKNDNAMFIDTRSFCGLKSEAADARKALSQSREQGAGRVTIPRAAFEAIGTALGMIRLGCPDPQEVAKRALEDAARIEALARRDVQAEPVACAALRYLKRIRNFRETPDEYVRDIDHILATHTQARSGHADEDVEPGSPEDERRTWNDHTDELLAALPIPAAAPAVAPASGVAELENFVRAKRFDREIFADDTAFVDWVLSRARHTLAALSAPSDAQPAQAVTDAMSDGQIMYEANYPNTKDAVRCPFNLLPEWNQNQWHRAAAERARSSQPPTAAQPAAVPAECVAAQQNALWEMKQRAQRAHQVCNDLRLAYPEITELGDDGVLHDAIHDILRVNTPGAAPPPPTSAESRGVG